MKIVKYKGTKIYLNSVLPFRGYLAMMLFGMIFFRKERESYLTDPNKEFRMDSTVNHENIHKEQIKDFGLPFFWLPPLQILIGGIIFYIIYGLEYFVRLFINGLEEAYDNISFEKEAYNYEYDMEYIGKRKHFAQWRKNKAQD